MTSDEWLLFAAEKLRNLESPQAEARILLRRVTGLSIEQLISSVFELSLDQLASLRTALDRRVNGEPMAYIVGNKDFYGRSFIVTRDVLIPRPETEVLVDAVLPRTKPGDKCADIGTGSGCIGITCALERPNTDWICTDVSYAALSIARQSAETLGARVRFQQSDLLDAFADESLDLIVSNPPYVARDDNRLEAMVRKYEPEDALISGESGLETIERLIEQSRRVLTSGGYLLFEFGQGQQESIRKLLSGWHEVETTTDLAGIERVAIAKKRGG